MQLFKRVLIRISLCMMILPLLAYTSNKDNGIKWLDIERALVLAKTQNKYIVVDVYTDWCHWCKVMDLKTYTDKRVIDFAEKKLIFVKLNAESANSLTLYNKKLTDRQLAMFLGVKSYPSTIFLSPEGNLVTIVPGFIEADTFVSILDFISNEHYKTTSYEEFLKKTNE